MALRAQVRFLKGAPAGSEAQGVITLSVALRDGSERAADAHLARFAPSAPPIDVTLLLDTSGSMSPFQHMLRVSTSTLLRLLPVPLSWVRVVTFDNLATERKARTQLATSETQADLVAWSDTLRVTSGSTNVHDALVKLTPTDTQHFVLLLSDGHANLGPKTSDKDLCSVAHEVLKPSTGPVLMSCIGFNEPENLQMPLLNGLAALCDGTVHIVQTPEKVHEAFGDVVGDMVSVLAGNVHLASKSSDDVILNDRFLGGGKLKGLHIRLGAPRHIPFRITKAGRVDLSFWDVIDSKDAALAVDLPDPPAEQAVDWEVHEALLFSTAAQLLDDVQKAKKNLRTQLALLGACPRASFNSPVPFAGGGTGAGGGLRILSLGFSNELTDDPQDIHEPPSKRQAVLDTMRLSMLQAWTTARDQIIEQDWAPVKAALVSFVDDIKTNPNHAGKRLSTLSYEFQELIATEFEEIHDDRESNLGFSILHQRSGVRDDVAPLGTLDFDPTPSQMASRMVSRTLSHRPDVSGVSAAEMLHDTLAVDLSADDDV